MTDRYDVVVIGGGVAGLVAAATAASAGASVALVESRRLGGRARTSAHDGFLFNQGPHAVYEHGALMGNLARLRVAATGGPPAVDRGAVWKGGQRHPLPLSTKKVLTSKLLGVRDKLAGGRVFAAMDKDDPAELAGVTLAEFLASHRATKGLSAFVEMFARLSTYSNAPEIVSAEAVILQYRLARGGVRYLDGGWQQLVDGLADAARGFGAKILDHRAATGVGPDGADWIVETSAGGLAAGAVVLAGGLPAEAARLVGDDHGWVEAAGPPVRASCLDLGLSKGAEVPLLLGLDEPYYLSTHAPPARLAPEGHQLIQVARYLRPDESPERAPSEAGLWRHAQRAGVEPGSVVASRYLHDMVVAGGLPLASRGGLAGRPGVVVADRPGLYLAGDWVGAEGLIGDAAAASGAAAAAAACARVGERAA